MAGLYSFQMDTVSKDKRSHGGKKRSKSALKKWQYNSRTGQWELVGGGNKTPENPSELSNDPKVADQSKYNLREERFEDRHEDEIVFKGAGHMPKWPKVNPQENDQHYWDACDKYERANGRLARTFIVALPRDMTDEQRYELARKFMADLAHDNAGQPLPFSFAIHQDKNNHNPHMHAMISERVNDGIPRNASTWFKRANPQNPKSGGAYKTEDLKAKAWLYGARKRWEVACNEALKEAGSRVRVDCRSLAAQGIDREPTVHIGPAKYMGEKARMASKDRIVHNMAVAELKEAQADVALYKAATHKPTKPLSRMAVGCVRQAYILDGKHAANKKRPALSRAPRVMVPPKLPKHFSSLAVMEYMQRIADQVSESIRRTIQAEAEQQQRIQAMWKDLHTIDHHYGMKTFMLKGEGNRNKVFKDFGFMEKHDPAFGKTGQPMDEDLAMVNEMCDILDGLTPDSTPKGQGTSSTSRPKPVSPQPSPSASTPWQIPPPRPR